MDIQEMANSYAEGKANETLTKIIAQAYIDGYNDGYKSGKDNVKIECNDTDFVDLGLPSGTLWASDYLKDSEGKICYLPYVEAKQYSIPSSEQWEELRNICKWDIRYVAGRKKFLCIGLNGNILSFDSMGYIKSTFLVNLETAHMWIKDDTEAYEKSSIIMYRSENSSPKLVVTTEKYFSGFKLPIRLVR